MRTPPEQQTRAALEAGGWVTNQATHDAFIAKTRAETLAEVRDVALEEIAKMEALPAMAANPCGCGPAAVRSLLDRLATDGGGIVSIKTGGVRPLPEFPYPPDEGSTHWEGCWSTRRHHNCAVAKITRLKAENERLRAALERLWDNVGDLANGSVQAEVRTALSTDSKGEDDG